MSEKSVWLHTLLQFAKYQISNYTITEFTLEVSSYDKSLNYSQNLTNNLIGQHILI